MNTEENNTLPTAPVKPVAPRFSDDESDVADALDFLKENGVAIVVGAALVVAGFVGYSAWKSSKVAREDSAASMLANSQTAPQFQEIINNYDGTKAAPLAQLSLAAAYFDQGQYDLAKQTFEQFLTSNPTHLMAPMAQLGIAQVLESAGNSQEALSAYDTFISGNPDHYQLASAIFGKARVLESEGRFSEARAVYEDFIASHPDSRWIARAETGLDFVNKQERASTGNPQPVIHATEPVTEASAVEPEAAATP